MVFPTLCAAVAFALPFVGAVQERGSVSWSFQGCYTDTSASRTLSEASTASANMTVESCIAFCSDGGFSLAGVEFGSQCFCDYVMQSTGVLTSSANCNDACGGNSTEMCGAGNLIDIYWNGTPPPTTPQQVGPWSYAGCFPDSVSARQLPNQQIIPGGVTVESCTSACQAGGFVFAGLEFGQECWCGNSLSASSVLRTSCATACVTNTTEFCGGPSLLTVYENPTAQVCSESTLTSAFTLTAVTTMDAVLIPLYVQTIETESPISWSILTANVSGPFTSEILSNGVLSTSEPQLQTTSLAVAVGESPLFITTESSSTAAGPYCSMLDPGIQGVTGQVLAVNTHSNLWALCHNITACNRLDVVYSPIANHPHYNLASCEPVYLSLTS
ncbi:hypothetical protein MSAN_01495300 [Mycena sanguinolenta]|uniref:WSC domain-containing protein n=1 Tax=Mycena sanguinolenta TaxID=230812 RepID=A0A8H6Y7M1_9AGAR|nr:hypothetical protein MSAN_01495300 [Mycena sanguinolenta]